MGYLCTMLNNKAIAFNDALTNALREMYDRAHLIRDNIRGKESLGNEIQLEAKCYNW